MFFGFTLLIIGRVCVIRERVLGVLLIYSRFVQLHFETIVVNRFFRFHLQLLPLILRVINPQMCTQDKTVNTVH